MGKPRTVTSEAVFAAAVRVTERRGLANLSVQELAAELDLKPASLYNHITGISEVKADVARYALGELDMAMRDAAVGYGRAEAMFRLAGSVRDFAHRRPELYNAINLYAAIAPSDYREMLGRHMNVGHQILDTYRMDDTTRTNFLLAFRSSVHGFVSLEAIGAFGDRKNLDEAFAQMTNQLLKMLEGTSDGARN